MGGYGFKRLKVVSNRRSKLRKLCRLGKIKKKSRDKKALRGFLLFTKVSIESILKMHLLQKGSTCSPRSWTSSHGTSLSGSSTTPSATPATTTIMSIRWPRPSRWTPHRACSMPRELRPEELPDGSPQQFDAIARRNRIAREDEQPAPELPPAA